MRNIHQSSQYKKDLKRYARDNEVIKKLFMILKLLAEEKAIPREFKPHILTGDYKGLWECHIENNVLLIWIDKDIVELVRLGSHSELFEKGRKR